VKGFITCLLIAFLPLLSSAANKVSGSDNIKMFSSKLGCMACHQGESLQPEKKAPKKNRHAPHPAHHAS
jgi:hypothetical protein